MSKLSDEQRQQLYAVTREEFNATEGKFRSHVRRSLRVRQSVRERLTGFGWEQILVNIAVQVIIALIKKWLERKESDPGFEPPAAMPLGFGNIEEGDYDD